MPYFHVVFTLPHELNALIRLNARALYGLLFDTAAQTLQEFASNPRWLGGTLGFTLVLHTWSQTLLHHPHVHGLVSGGTPRAGGGWQPAKPGFLFPVQALSRVFRGKYLDALARLREKSALHLPQAVADAATWATLLAQLCQIPWVVYLKPPLSGPEQVLEYLARYTHRVALSNARRVSVNAEEVCLHYRDRAHGNARRRVRLPSHEFLRCFLLHVLPAGFKRIRHYSLTANRSNATQLAACRAALHAPAPAQPQVESAEAFLIRLSGRDVRRSWMTAAITAQLSPIQDCAILSGNQFSWIEPHHVPHRWHLRLDFAVRSGRISQSLRFILHNHHPHPRRFSSTPFIRRARTQRINGFSLGSLVFQRRNAACRIQTS